MGVSRPIEVGRRQQCVPIGSQVRAEVGHGSRRVFQHQRPLGFVPGQRRGIPAHGAGDPVRGHALRGGEVGFALLRLTAGREPVGGAEVLVAVRVVEEQPVVARRGHRDREGEARTAEVLCAERLEIFVMQVLKALEVRADERHVHDAFMGDLQVFDRAAQLVAHGVLEAPLGPRLEGGGIGRPGHGVVRHLGRGGVLRVGVLADRVAGEECDQEHAELSTVTYTKSPAYGFSGSWSAPLSSTLI